MQNPIADNITQIRARIRSAEKKFDRIPGIVQLIAVSKTRAANELRKAAQTGIKDFAENYLQEALTKQPALADLHLTWHFIGPIQSNKTADIATHFDWVQSVDRLKIARRLNEQRPQHLTPLNICLQVNISNEKTKSGVSLSELDQLALQISQLPRLKLRGLMAIPAPDQSESALRSDFAEMRKALNKLNDQGFNLDTLSMGMTNDLECAIAEGATMVRIGTAIFGSRD
ncbi:MAG: YggS family pyridoxal phosphate-dependent enzyme [Pseudomonadales bacterium]|nr:YggS family pyridoxal phosphate-dependent enzyme [Pseudomonadales bacterium]